MSKVWVAVTFLLTLGGFALAGDSAHVFIRAGIGYDFLSQQYFLDSVVASGEDSVLTKWSLSTNYLNDLKGIFDIRWTPLGARRLELRAVYEQTPDIIRTRLSSEWRPKWRKIKLTSHSELDWRDRVHGATSSGDNYILGSNRTSIRVPIGQRWSLRSQAMIDGVHFYGQSTYSYDYYRLGGAVGLEKLFGDFSIMSLQGFMNQRQVIDSQYLSYISGGGELSFFGSVGRADIDLYSRFERKDYDRADQREDYSRLDLDLRSKLSLGKGFFCQHEFQGDLTWFDASDLLNANYQRIKTAILGGLGDSRLSFGIGPQIDWLAEQKKSDYDGEAYFELGGKTSLDYMYAGSLFGSLETVTGHRNLKDESDFQSDFSFERINLLADWTIHRTLDLSMMLAAEWEWHRVSTDNSRLVLFSSTLTYRF